MYMNKWNVYEMWIKKPVVNDIFLIKYAHVKQLSLFSIYLSNNANSYMGRRTFLILYVLKRE